MHWQRRIKRVFDFCAAAAALVVLAPVLAAVAVAVRLDLGRPVFFRQQRPGLGGKPFWMYKFRTMREEEAPDGRPLPDRRRLTRFGGWLRATSLDELPELWNVLRGDMSLVGPRPLLTAYLDRYTPRQARRHEVRPGLTGWAQIHGRNAVDWPRRFELDVWYVEHGNLLVDAKILLLTVVKVFRREGISADGCATMPEFLGTKEPWRNV